MSRSALQNARKSARARATGWPGEFRLHQPHEASDAPNNTVQALERAKDQVRLLLDRYGVLTRELLSREAPALRWRKLFGALRMMELSGEIIAGSYFAQHSAPQFISEATLAKLVTFSRRQDDDHPVIWLSTLDPCAPCSLPGEFGAQDGTPLKLPARRRGNYLWLQGSQLLGTCERSGHTLHLHIAPDDSRASQLFVLFNHLLSRRHNPLDAIRIARINSTAAIASPWFTSLKNQFQVERDHRTVTLRRKNDTF